MSRMSVTLCALIILILAGCGRGEYSLFAKQVTAFEAEGKQRGVSVSVDFDIKLSDQHSDLPHDVGARCNHNIVSKGIEVSSAFFHSASDSELELALFHELGHCVLGLSHSTGIMSAVLLQGYEYEAHRKELLDELFKTKE